MPMFHDPDRPLDELGKMQPPRASALIERKVSEESIRTEFCEGPVLDDSHSTPPEPQPEASFSALSVEISDRAEFIERLKRGESPTWVPNRKLEEYYGYLQKTQQVVISQTARNDSSLLPAIELRRGNENPADVIPIEGPYEANLNPPSEIERPRSALHSGNFTDDTASEEQHHPFRKPTFVQNTVFHGPLGTSLTTPWYSPSSLLHKSFRSDLHSPSAQESSIDTARRPWRSRAPSLHSYSSSYVLKPPTSPLVQQSNNDDTDFSPINLSESPSMSNRRHTLPPQSLNSLRSLPSRYDPTLSPVALQSPSSRVEGLSPNPTHRPRRSWTSGSSFQAGSSPQTPAYLRSRRPSFSSEASPLQHATMVGSYEESILRGRMSTGPSKPLDFTAQIGVLGKGNHKPKYPPHVTVQFPAVYYNWNNGASRNSSTIEDEPSPYVGHIDLEHSLPPAATKELHRRHRGTLRTDDPDISGDIDSAHENDCRATNLILRKKEKRRRRSTSPKAPVGGSYRIPQQGQLQIMIKTPNKTAVKLFLVPYDLTDMDGGTKTFIRQRCYSAGPIIETPLTSSPGLASSRDLNPAAIDSKNKSTLRYLIHLNICCPSKGRFYLYQHIRVVFANRVPDNKEKLQNDIQLPEPKYSVYKANRDSLLSSSSAGIRLAAEKAQRRRSYGFGNSMAADSFKDIRRLDSRSIGAESSFPMNIAATAAPPVPPIPFQLKQSMTEPRSEELGAPYDPMDLDSSRPTTSSGLQSPLSDKTSRISNTLSSSYRSSTSGGSGSDSFSKLSRGDVGYGGMFGRPGTPEPGEGLLARRLRGLGMDKEARNTNDESTL